MCRLSGAEQTNCPDFGSIAATRPWAGSEPDRQLNDIAIILAGMSGNCNANFRTPTLIRCQVCPKRATDPAAKPIRKPMHRP